MPLYKSPLVNAPTSDRYITRPIEFVYECRICGKVWTEQAEAQACFDKDAKQVRTSLPAKGSVVMRKQSTLIVWEILPINRRGVIKVIGFQSLVDGEISYFKRIELVSTWFDDKAAVVGQVKLGKTRRVPDTREFQLLGFSTRTLTYTGEYFVWGKQRFYLTDRPYAISRKLALMELPTRRFNIGDQVEFQRRDDSLQVSIAGYSDAITLEGRPVYRVDNQGTLIDVGEDRLHAV